MLIFLIGLPGAGKSTLGHRLALASKIPFIDLDTIIEEKAEETISEIFEQKGEAFFRQLESDTLRTIGNNKSYQQGIIALGGGTPCFHNNMAYINAQGLSLYLRPDTKVIVDRVSKQQHRPLLKGENPADKIEKLLRDRSSFYEQAHLTITKEPQNTVSFLENLQKQYALLFPSK